MIYHMIAFAAGAVLDLILADPYRFPHPVRYIGRLISFLEKKLNTSGRRNALKAGRLTVFIVIACTVLAYGIILAAAYIIYPWAGAAVEAFMTWQLLAAGSLDKEATKVCRALKKGDVESARSAVSMIVGRDTQSLSEEGIIKAATETVAENTSDGVIAPMLYTAIGGPVLGAAYKAINTMDSMIGYKNDRYIKFGRAAARLDDIVNFLPSRISAVFMIFSCLFLGKDFDFKGACRIFRRDRRKHASPNSAQTESVCAGALGIRLAGDASYFGVVHKKPFIGDETRPVCADDIRKAIKLMYGAAAVCFILCEAVFAVIWIV